MTPRPRGAASAPAMAESPRGGTAVARCATAARCAACGAETAGRCAACGVCVLCSRRCATRYHERCGTAACRYHQAAGATGATALMAPLHDSDALHVAAEHALRWLLTVLRLHEPLRDDSVVGLSLVTSACAPRHTCSTGMLRATRTGAATASTRKAAAMTMLTELARLRAAQPAGEWLVLLGSVVTHPWTELEVLQLDRVFPARQAGPGAAAEVETSTWFCQPLVTCQPTEAARRALDAGWRAEPVVTAPLRPTLSAGEARLALSRAAPGPS